MPQFYKVPFTFTVKGALTTFVDKPEDAILKAQDTLQADESNLPESNIFFEEGEPVTDITVDAPSLGEVTLLEGQELKEAQALFDAEGKETDDPDEADDDGPEPEPVAEDEKLTKKK